MKIQVTKFFEFEACHQLTPKETFGKCANFHGHTYKLQVTVSAKNLTNGMVMNFKELKGIVNENVVDRLDHQNLNDFFELSTAENMVQEIALIIKASLPKKITLENIKLFETSNSYAEWIK